MADNNLFEVEIITPERIFYKANVNMIEFVSSEGEMGVYKDHIPLTTLLAPGVAKFHEEGTIKEAALYTGFVEILKDRVIIMAEIAEWPDEIDLNRAKEAKIRAERRLKGNDETINIVRAELALRRAIVRIELAERYK